MSPGPPQPAAPADTCSTLPGGLSETRSHHLTGNLFHRKLLLSSESDAVIGKQHREELHVRVLPKFLVEVPPPKGMAFGGGA